VTILPAAAWGQVRLGSEFQANIFTFESQTQARVSADAAGNFVVTWTSYGPGYSTAVVFARRYHASGTALDANEFAVSSVTGLNSIPFTASDQSGNFVVAWRSWVNGSEDDVFARTFDPAGTAGGAFRVNTYTLFSQNPRGVAMDAIGNFVVLWQDYSQDGSGLGVFGQRYDAFGVIRGPDFQVNTFTTGHQGSAALASDAFGNFLVAWSSDRGDGDGVGIFAQRYDVVGAAQGIEFQVNSYTSGIQTNPAVASDLDGNFVVVWMGPDGSGRGIFGQRYDLSGTAQGGEFRVNTFTTAEQLSPRVSADDHGFVVVWSSFGQDNSSYAVMARRYDASGVPQGGEFRVNTYTTNRQEASSVASAADGTFVVVWTSLNQDGHLRGVFGQRFRTDLIFQDGFQ
jgi:hypothetical protein